MNPQDVKEGPQIVQYADMGKLPDETLRELAKQEREWFGYRGFGEYAVCTNPECRRIQSIDEVYDVKDTAEEYVPLAELEKTRQVDLRCPDCDAKAELLLHPELMSRYLQAYFSQQVYGALLIKDGEIEGSSVSFVAPLKVGVETNINYRGTYDVDGIIREIAERTGRTIEETSAQDTLFWNRMALSRKVRGGQNFANLAAAVLNQHPEYDELPAVGETRDDSNLYPLIHAFGYEDIQRDQYGGVAILLKRAGDLRRAVSMPREEFRREFGDGLAEGKRIQAEFKKNHPSQNDKRYFRGVPLVAERLISYGIPVNDVPDASSFETKEGVKARIENYTSKKISDETLREISDCFRYIFANSFKQYLVYPSIGEPISAAEVFKTGKKYVPPEDLDGFDPDSYPPHPVTGEKAVFWHDPETTFRRFKEKSGENAHFTVFRDIGNGKLLGLMFGHQTTVQGVFETEEWHDPLYYSSVRSPKPRDFNGFMNRINEERVRSGLPPFTPDSKIYGWNCVATDPKMRGLQNLTRLTAAFFNNIPPELRESLEVIGEGQFASKAHALFVAGGAHEIKGVLSEKEDLEPGDPVLLSAPLGQLAELFTSSPEQINQKLRTGPSV
jgi:hypothetical protein